MTNKANYVNVFGYMFVCSMVAALLVLAYGEVKNNVLIKQYCEENQNSTHFIYEGGIFDHDYDFYCFKKGNNMEGTSERIFIKDEIYKQWRNTK